MKASKEQIQTARQAVNFRRASAPPIVPKCANCKYFAYDADDREGPRGIYFEKKNKRCTTNRFSTASGSICNNHEFRHADKRDV